MNPSRMRSAAITHGEKSAELHARFDPTSVASALNPHLMIPVRIATSPVEASFDFFDSDGSSNVGERIAQALVFQRLIFTARNVIHVVAFR